MRLNFLRTEFPLERFVFAGAGFRASRFGDGEGEATGDGDASGVGLELGLATAAASGSVLLDLTATSTKAIANTTAIAPAIISKCFVGRLENETERRENE